MSSHVLCLDTLLTFISQMMDRVENQVRHSMLGKMDTLCSYLFYVSRMMWTKKTTLYV